MKQVPIKLGPVALLLTVIAICLTVMAILTFSTSNADKTMADRFADSTQTRYALEASGQQFLRDADQTLQEGGTLTDLPDVKSVPDALAGTIEKRIESEGYELTIRLEPDGEEAYKVIAWTLEKEWEENQNVTVWQP